MSANDSSAFNPLFLKTVALLPFSLTSPWLHKPLIKILIPVLSTLGVYLVIEQLIKLLAKLPHEAYFQPHLTFSVLSHTGAIRVLILSVLLIFLWKKASLLSRWQVFQQGKIIRYFVLFLAFLIVWPLATLGYNFYFNQGYYLDRILLVMLLLALWWRPVFILPFLVLALVMLLQLKQPNIGGSILAHKLQVLNILILFAATFIIHALSGYRKTHAFVFLCCCVVASAYWLPAFAKLQLDWFNHGQLHHMPMSAYAHGWLGFLQPKTIVKLSQHLAWLEWPMRVFVMVLEAGCILFMLRPKVSLFLLGAMVIFHLGVFLLIGFLFWTWIFLDIALLFLLLKGGQIKAWAIYTKQYLLVSMILIGFCSYWANPPALAWFDTRVSYTYQIEAVNELGEQFILEPSFFAPYEDVFTMSSFNYLIKDNTVLVGPYGVTKNSQLADTLAQINSAKQLLELENQQHESKFDPRRSASFYHFIAEFVANHNRHANSIINLYWLAPPRQFWSFEHKTHSDTKKRITHVIVNQLTTLYTEESLELIRKKELKRMDIHK